MFIRSLLVICCAVTKHPQTPSTVKNRKGFGLKIDVACASKWNHDEVPKFEVSPMTNLLTSIIVPVMYSGGYTKFCICPKIPTSIEIAPLYGFFRQCT